VHSAHARWLGVNFTRMYTKYLFITVFLLAGCGVGDCEKDSETAIFARNLPKDRLGLLFQYSETLGEESSKEHYYDGTPLPEEISDLPIKVLRVDKRKVLFRLEGCLDHHLDLVVVRTGDNSPRIELRSGEVPRIKEVLWAK